MQNIGQSTIKNLVLFLPPLDEQKVISQYIRDEVAKLDGIVRRTETALAYLTGYRNALITAATMGEIDVRNVKIQGAA
jgi:type I restriction enzyme S subunit